MRSMVEGAVIIAAVCTRPLHRRSLSSVRPKAGPVGRSPSPRFAGEEPALSRYCAIFALIASTSAVDISPVVVTSPF